MQTKLNLGTYSTLWCFLLAGGDTGGYAAGFWPKFWLWDIHFIYLSLKNSIIFYVTGISMVKKLKPRSWSLDEVLISISIINFSKF